MIACLLLALTLTVGSFQVKTLVSRQTATAVSQPLVSAFSSTVTAGPNIGIVGEAPPDRQQVEPTIAIDPRNPSIIVAGAQDLRLIPVGGHRWHGFYRSTDGGATWTNTLLPGFLGDTSPQGLTSPLRTFNATSDPVLAFDRNGNLYYTGLGLTATSSGVFPTGLFVAKFTNDGGTYFNTTLISAGVFPDKPWIAVDTTGGAYDGNVYVAYDANLTATQAFATLFVRSTDGGATWSTPFYTPPDMTGELAGVAVDPSGNVYVSADAFDPIHEFPLGYVEVTKITGGGTTIAQTTKAVNPVSLIPSPLPGGSFRTFTIPQIAADQNGVYLVWDDFRTTNANVFFTRSTDGGTTWSPPLMVNDVTAGQHFFPTVASSGGVISVAWYDSRFNTGTTLTVLDVFYARSLDSGVSFSSNMRVTSVSFNPELVERTDFGDREIFMGDYIQIAASPTLAQVIWSDNRNACDTVDAIFGCVDQDAFTAAIGKPDFTISASPTMLNVFPGNANVSTLSLASQNRFNGTINLLSSVSPSTPSITISFNPSSPTLNIANSGGTNSSIMTASTTVNTPPGAYIVTVIARNSTGSPIHSVTITINVMGPDFSMSVNPSSLSLNRGTSGPFTITVQSLGGFAGTIMFSATTTPMTKKSPSLSSISPVTLSSSSPTGSSVLTVSTKGSTGTGMYTMTVTGVSGSISHAVTVTVNVTK